jgi:colanic acid/amylovoran biosynthesis glycosyltransferase
VKPAGDDFTPVSVIIPAHNEEAVIERCLTSLQAGAQDGELDIIVVCNGCQDATADVVRQVAPNATVIEVSVASKVAALNAGDRSAKYFPRFYVDADVELPLPDLRRVARALVGDGILCAAPRPLFVLEDRSWAIRAFYDVWQEIPYLNEDMIGSGVYALSEQGRARFEEFPELTADDQFVQQLFDRSERKAVEGARFALHPPRSLRGLLAVRTRAYRGKRQLALSGMARVAPPALGAKSALSKARQPTQVPAVAVYAAVNIVAKGLARRSAHARWERDDSARGPRRGGQPPAGAVAGDAPSALRVCYVTSNYPAPSHTFVMREIMGARADGLVVETVSVHKAGSAQLLAVVDKEEAARTWNIFPLDLPGFVRAHLRAASENPRAYVGTLWHALSSAPPGARARLWQLFYFGEAIALWDHTDVLAARHLHAHLANVSADLAWLASRYGKAAQPEKGWKWSFTMHGPTELYSTERFNLARKVANADAVVCISEYTRSQLMYLSAPEHWDKLHVVHCGADLERYPYVAPQEATTLSVLCVCRLVPEKGLDVLVRAVASIARGGADIRLVIVGSGPLEGPLRRTVQQLGLEGRVLFEGAVGQDDMASYYADCDVFCLPSFAEGVPVVLMEAMATGRPVIATRITGIPELIEDGVSGLLVAPGSLDQLVAALETLAASRELREQMGLAGRHKVEEEFDARRCASQVAAIFRSMAPVVAD